ncbi:hypothetical protein GPK90_04590 [Clostridium sp. MCC344]|nr:hypothetical protein [Clostridium sp. MCC344]MBT9788623.1 hypothetical protein [Clostridium sp. MCC344]
MYTFYLTDKKELRATNRCTIHQREKLVDNFQFLIPKTYENIDLTGAKIELQYLNPGNESCRETLTQSEDIEGRDDYMSYILPIDTNFTRFAGDVKLKLAVQKVNIEEKIFYYLESSESIVTIAPMSDYFAFVSDDVINPINEKIAELDARFQALDKLAEAYDTTKADNINLDSETSELYLTANGKAIGDKISINTLGDAIADDTEDGLIKVIL